MVIALKYEHIDMVCPYCGSSSIIFDPDSHEYVCTKCGAVIDDRVIDVGRDYRFFENELAVRRTSGAYTNRVHDGGLGATIVGGIRTTDKETIKKWREIRRIQKKARVTKKDRIVERALRHLNDYVRLLKPPKYVAETAGNILQRAVQGRNYKNKTLKMMAAASIYLAYKVHGIFKSAKLFAKEAGISYRDLWHAEKRIHQAISDINKIIKRDDPAFFVPYLTHKLGLSDKARFLAAYLINLSKKLELNNGKSAIGLATAAVYVSSILLDEKRTQLEVASAAEVTDVTIRNRYSDLIDNLDITVEL